MTKAKDKNAMPEVTRYDKCERIYKATVQDKGNGSLAMYLQIDINPDDTPALLYIGLFITEATFKDVAEALDVSDMGLIGLDELSRKSGVKVATIRFRVYHSQVKLTPALNEKYLGRAMPLKFYPKHSLSFLKRFVRVREEANEADSGDASPNLQAKES